MLDPTPVPETYVSSPMPYRSDPDPLRPDAAEPIDVLDYFIT
jgi:hypothetical protein